MVSLTGQFSWRQFLQRYAAAFLLSGGSLATAIVSLTGNFPGQYLIGGMTLIIGVAGLLTILIWIMSLLTWFEADETNLTFTRPLRARRSVPLDDVVDMPAWETNQHGVRIRLRDGSSIYIDFRSLENGLELAKLCLAQVQRGSDRLEGNLDIASVATVMVKQIFVVILLIGLSLFGMMMLALGIGRPGVQMQTPWVFLALAVVTSGLSLTGGYYLVLRPWLGTIRWFRLENELLSFRTVLWPTVHQQYLNQLESVKTHRPHSSGSETDVRTAIHFRDGMQVRLPVGLLPGAERLIDLLKSELEQRDAAHLPPAKETPLTAHPLLPQVRPHLQPGEEVYYLGRSDLNKQWSETLGEMAFGGILAIVGGAGAVISIWTAIAEQSPFVLIMTLVSSLFIAVGWRGLLAPYFKRRLQEKMLYAVTSQRVLVLNGCFWGDVTAPMLADEAERTFTIDEVRNYEVETKGRDIAFSGRWISGRKNRKYWVHQGFLAPDNFDAALSAIRRLLSENPRDCDKPTAV
ncbi:hypothetical protein LOC68_13735 [Blastopirellula sp. JC732]|uniref:Uncharacterized protein n=1 Tax=Blastopirellula sediminis TaxID=2894196 RepID=A0A9X1SH59_9BACT|nr:hypothetical protein [Blastopirellula sediminis]MCC9607251.1 hypothetical protein [Blastopirellula sediminis]MCC9629456.1 hypothetical protein [Blastopirellula sediminis]